MRATTKFVAVATLALGASLAVAAVTFAQPIWAEQPGPEDFAKFYPPTTDGPAKGLARIECKVAPDGVLSDCRVLSEDPTGAGFGPYAQSIAMKFRATPEAAKKMNGAVVLPIRFGPAEEAPPSRAARFQRNGAYKRLGDAGPYYPDRAARTGQTAVVDADCRVADDAKLHGCRIVSVSNPGYGFEFAFLKMAQHGWMTAAPVGEGVAAPADGVWRFRMLFDAKRR